MGHRSEALTAGYCENIVQSSILCERGIEQLRIDDIYPVTISMGRLTAVTADATLKQSIQRAGAKTQQQL